MEVLFVKLVSGIQLIGKLTRVPTSTPDTITLIDVKELSVKSSDTGFDVVMQPLVIFSPELNPSITLNVDQILVWISDGQLNTEILNTYIQEVSGISLSSQLIK